MSWTTPKTNWTRRDFYSVKDLQRVMDNMKYLKDYLQSLQIPTPNYQPMPAKVSIGSIPTVSFINRIEHNLNVLRVAVRDIGLPGRINWFERLSPSYVRNPDYTDWNRWEIILDGVMKDALQLSGSDVYSNEFYCGEV